jgi:septal ring factor EnvC (AmiA/AmiB activator)
LNGKPVKRGLFSNHNPNDGAVILSALNNEVKSVVDGRVLKVFNHSEEEHSVILMTSDSIAIIYRFMLVNKVQEGDVVKKGDTIGLAGKNKDGINELSFSYWVRKVPVDPRTMCKCRN